MDVLTEVRSTLGQTSELTVPASSVQPEHHLSELPGVDSLSLVDIVQILERRMGIRLDDDAVFELETIGDLCRLIEQSLP
ncbi:acyl carrier protein [Nocardia tenerifensis]|uniref:Acyl carrier protein n=1 Tax=Nocardia tenerifensis TaxID=228006 RepID=A0A318JQU2_9NOCA|nr:phosphopantetheine-binding protein [Nocardia tenerifensis]PXX58101.1 acyl carrier protein [Nocardia tenerifensis]